MKAILFFTVMIVTCLSQSQVSNDYYLSFVQTVGLNTQVSEEIDCSKVVRDVLSGLKAVLEQEYQDTDSLLDGVTSFVDKMKFEVSPICRGQSGDFETFLSGYFGDAKALKEAAEANLDDQYNLIGKNIDDASDSLNVGEDTEAGKLHAEIIRTLLGLDGQNIQESQSAAAEPNIKKDSSDSDNIFGGIYQEYMNQLNILNAVDEDDDTVGEKSDSNSNKDDASEGYVQGLISKFQQIKRGGSRQLQEDAKHFEARSYNMDL